jgi:hypothetical protein
MLSKETGILLPYLISIVGVLFDYLTTTIGLSFGLHETNAFYQPVLVLAIFWGALAVFSQILPKRWWIISRNILASVSFLGAVNNTLVITGIFSGLRI